ncbi:MAG: Ribosomal RNA adenine dimethylase, phospholipid N-methyltransferase [Parcubacteria group bacterium GW2011_GWA2_47_16]|nr:MAG: Ribosomal RNA adenine dimethylase, phospholipid N-methyltransferase [Parcubacteria group bacterium GW2011_GWA2_47_16]
MNNTCPKTPERERKDAFLFAKNFFKNPLRNASITPSSVFAGHAMMQGIDFSKIHTVMELGPGTGVFTTELVKKCALNTKIVLVELEKSYVENLRRKFGARVTVENANAQLLDTLLLKHGISKLDLLISGLPFFEEAINDRLLASIKKQTDTGTIFRFFTYMPPVVKRIYKNLPIRKTAFVLRNIPPLWIYGVN